MPQFNPYASPLSMDSDVPAATLAEQEEFARGLYRKGKLLVMHKQAVLPQRCVKSNQPSTRNLRRKLHWHHPLLFITVPISLLLYVILALVLTKRATIEIGMTDEWFRKRRQVILLAWGLFLLGLAATIGGVFVLADTSNKGPEGPVAMILGILVSLGGAVYGSVAARMVAPTRITKDYIWLKGVHPDFLAALPDWPYQP